MSLRLLKSAESTRCQSVGRHTSFSMSIRTDLSLVPYSGASSVEGHFSALYRGVSINFMNMNNIVQFNKDEYVKFRRSPFAI